MKKTLLVVLIVLLSISLFACGETPVKESTPVISVNPTTIEINVGGEVDLLSGVSATDEVDGTVSVTIDDRGGFDNTKAGTYTIKYKAVNSQGKEATVTRTIKVNKVEVVPVITVNPAEVEIYAGEDVDLLFGVSATSDGETISVIIEDDNDFDNSKEGTYTIKYKAVNSDGKEATATRTIIVNKPLSELALEVRKNYLGENKWAGNIITFKHELFVELDADAEISRQSGVFYNTTDASITLSVEGSYGCSTVLTANGVVVEGRDGANSKLVNAQNPTRTSSTTTKFDEDTTVSSAFAKNLVIPAKGYAVVIQSNYAGTTADSDGRSFMNYNVIYSIGNVVKLYWVDDESVITPYVNQGPEVSGNTIVYVPLNSVENVNNLVAAGLTITDDSGTFELSDDTAITEVTVKDNGGYDSSKEGEYTFTLSVTDGEIEKEFTRVVSVLGADKCTTIQVGDNSHIVLNSSVAIDQDLTSVGSYTYIVYTPNYTLPNGETSLGYTNGYGEAFLMNEYGEIVVIYDGANGRKFTAEHHTVPNDTETCTPASYLADAFKDAQDNGWYLLVAANSTANNATGGSRAFLLANRTYGVRVKITGVQFAVREVAFAVNGKEFKASDEQVVINKVVSASDAGKQKMMIYTADFDADAITCNGWGVALVLNKYGILDRIYDGANAKLFDAENPSGKTGAGFGGGDYAVYAYANLKDGETLVILPNDGVNAADSARTFGLGLRMDGSIGKVATLTKFTFAEKAIVFGINNKEFKAVYGTYVINEVVSASDAGKQKMIIYTKECTADAITCNGYGVAIVLNKYGILDRIYDGANGKLFDAENPSGKTGAGFGGGDYAVYAYANLKDGETLIIFPNDGVNAADSARTFGLGLRMDGSIGKAATLTGFTFADELIVKIGNNSFTKDGDITCAYNDPNATNTSHDFLVFTSAFSGTSKLVNGYGVAFVIKDDKVVRIYDGPSGKYFDADNSSGVQDASKCTAADYFKFALASLQSGEWLLVAPHDGGSNLARGFLYSNRTIGAVVEFNLVTVATDTTSMNALGFDNNIFYGASVLTNSFGKAGDYDVAIYSYGYTGRVIKNGWCEAFVISAQGKVVRIYDGVNSKYYDTENTDGVARSTQFELATVTFDAFESLQPGEMLVLGFNGGRNSDAGRSFLVNNRKINAVAKVFNVSLPTPAAEETTIKPLVVDGDKYYLSSAIPSNGAVTSAAVPFLVYTYGYDGTPVANGFGVALIIKEGKVVRIYDGASGKYWDADNNGVQDASKCAAGTYLAQAFASLQEGETLLCAPNGGTTGNVARGFLYDHRALGKDVVIPTF